MNTKEHIQEAALALFAQKGFDASSVRDIAAKTGIKDSSLYFHFQNKQAILDSLIDSFIHRAEQMMGLLDGAMGLMTTMDDGQFYGVTKQFIQSYFMDEFMGGMIMVMNHERSHNEQLKALYNGWCIEKPLSFQALMMEKLQEIGYLHKAQSPAFMALAYYAPIFLYYNQYLGHAAAAQDTASFQEAVLAATENFLNIYKEGSGAE